MGDNDKKTRDIAKKNEEGEKRSEKEVKQVENKNGRKKETSQEEKVEEDNGKDIEIEKKGKNRKSLRLKKRKTMPEMKRKS